MDENPAKFIEPFSISTIREHREELSASVSLDIQFFIRGIESERNCVWVRERSKKKERERDRSEKLENAMKGRPIHRA